MSAASWREGEPRAIRVMKCWLTGVLAWGPFFECKGPWREVCELGVGRAGLMVLEPIILSFLLMVEAG